MCVQFLLQLLAENLVVMTVVLEKLLNTKKH
jgi:hypothetical protein